MAKDASSKEAPMSKRELAARSKPQAGLGFGISLELRSLVLGHFAIQSWRAHRQRD
jgi:hypothetical protein